MTAGHSVLCRIAWGREAVQFLHQLTCGVSACKLVQCPIECSACCCVNQSCILWTPSSAMRVAGSHSPMAYHVFVNGTATMAAGAACGWFCDALPLAPGCTRGAGGCCQGGAQLQVRDSFSSFRSGEESFRGKRTGRRDAQMEGQVMKTLATASGTE